VRGVFTEAAERSRNAESGRPLYLRLAENLTAALTRDEAPELPSARALAAECGLNRATVTAAYRELARRGLVVLRAGRRGRGAPPVADPERATGVEPPQGTVDLARYAPDGELLPAGKVFRWLGLGQAEGEEVAQYGDAFGYPPLRRWLADRLGSLGVAAAADELLVTAGVQHGLDLLLRALLRAGDTVLVEDPSYPGLPPLLALHQLRAVGIPVGRDGIDPGEVAERLRTARPRMAILTPTLHNPSGLVIPLEQRREILQALLDAGVLVVEELFDPGLVSDGAVPPPLASLDSRVVVVGSFSKALFPGLRVGWVAGPREVIARVATLKRATDLSGSPFLEAAAWTLCRRGVLEAQLERLRQAARRRRDLVLEKLKGAPAGVGWTVPRGGFSLLVLLPAGWSSRALAARAATRGVWILCGPLMSVSGRDDVVRLAYAAAGGETLSAAVERFVGALAPSPAVLPLV
jgi:DNA-binding transcriptional MocR family regulator